LTGRITDRSRLDWPDHRPISPWLVGSQTDLAFIGCIILQSFSEHKRHVNPPGQPPHGITYLR